MQKLLDTAPFPIELSPDSAGGHGRKAVPARRSAFRHAGVELHWLCAAVIAAMMFTDKRRRVSRSIRGFPLLG